MAEAAMRHWRRVFTPQDRPSFTQIIPKIKQNLFQAMKKLFTAFFSRGYWIFALMAIMLAGLIVKDIIIPWQHGDITYAVGDGKNVSTYGFTLSPCMVDQDLIAASGNSKDALGVLDDPATITPDEAAKIDVSLSDSGGFIEGPDRVIGVVIGSEARAYPLPMMNWHGVINDTLGGVPIAITYDGFCDSAVVFDRRVNGQEIKFGYSGLVYNSDLLIYDRQTDASKESLWSQIGCRAITGPAAAAHARLTALPCQVVTWEKWESMYPQAKMMAGLEKLYGAYRENPYGPYYHNPGDLRYPIRPMWDQNTPGLKDRLIAVELNGHWQPILFDTIFSQADAGGAAHVTIDGVQLVFQCWQEPQWRTVALLSPNQTPTAYSLVFAWYAQHPEEFTGAEAPKRD
jgi:Protein of unknown function (DUF3179)